MTGSAGPGHSSASSRDWLRVIKRDARSRAIADLLDKYGTTIEKARWIHGTGRLAVPKGGVYLYLWKPGDGKAADIEIVGVEFSFSGMRGGVEYTGHVPFRIAPGDSPDQIRKKLRPRRVEMNETSRTATAMDRTHRFVARFDSRGRLAALAILCRFTIRRRAKS